MQELRGLYLLTERISLHYCGNQLERELIQLGVFDEGGSQTTDRWFAGIPKYGEEQLAATDPPMYFGDARTLVAVAS